MDEQNVLVITGYNVVAVTDALESVYIFALAVINALARNIYRD